MFGWGPGKNLDYWTARAAGLVPPEERRAVSLLAEVSDEGRFALYCRIGMFPAMGNVTKRTYLIQRHVGVLELEDGRPHTSWCIHAPNRRSTPESDHVVGLKCLLEGEELTFRSTGNPSPRGTLPPDGVNPYREEFLPGSLRESPAIRDNEEFLEFMEPKYAVERMRWREWLARESIIDSARRGGKPKEIDVSAGCEGAYIPQAIFADSTNCAITGTAQVGFAGGFVGINSGGAFTFGQPVMRRHTDGRYVPFV